jgi:hypothetical protein
MLYPRFAADSFWSFAESCKLMGVRRPAPPLGLITVAAMLPGSWTVRVDCNTASIADDDFAWADLVFTGGMLPQQADTRRLIEVCRSRGKCRRVGAVHSIKSRPRAANVRCPLLPPQKQTFTDATAMSVLPIADIAVSLDHLVSAREHGRRRGESRGPLQS